DFAIPILVGETVPNESTGESEVAADRLPDLFPEQCPDHGIKNSVDQGAFIFMAQILRGDEIKTGLQDRLNQRADPIRRNTFNARFNNATRSGSQTLCRRKNRLESAVASGYRL